MKKNFKQRLATLLTVALIGSSMGTVTFAEGIGGLSSDSSSKFAASGSEADSTENEDIRDPEKNDNDEKQEVDEEEVIQDKEPEKEEQNIGDKENEAGENETLGEVTEEVTNQEEPEILEPENQIMVLEAELEEEEEATPSEAEYMAPDKPVWMIGKNAPAGKDRPGWGKWTDELSKEEQDQVYTTLVNMYRDGELLRGGNMDEYISRADFRYWFEEPGDYQFQCIYLMTDAEDMTDDDWSPLSDTYTYKEIGRQAPVPTGLRWEKDGTMAWDDVLKDIKNYESYADEDDGGTRFLVKLYKKDEQGNYEYDAPLDFFVTGKTRVEKKLNRLKDIDPNATYVFTVSTIGDMLTYDYSEESIPSEPLYMGDVTSEAQGTLDSLNGQSDVKAAVENASLSQDERDVLKLAVQTDQSVAEKLRELETKYMAASGKEDIVITSDSTLVDAKKVTVTGGVLNGAGGVTFQPAQIDDEALHYKKVIGLDISLDGAASGEELNFPVLITMPVPSGVYANKLVIVHYKNSGDKEYIYPRINQDGTISFAVTSFSEFAFVDTSDGTEEKPDDNNNSSSSGSHSSSHSGGSGGGGSSKSTASVGTSGTWIQDQNGWWFEKVGGSYPVSDWLMTTDGNWFRFDEKGYMMTGWFIDQAGNRFYLNPISDGTKGAMKIGWQTIDGKVYYLNPVSDGTKGAMKIGWQMVDGSWYYFSMALDEAYGMMLTNATTPDGYVVGADGKRIIE